MRARSGERDAAVKRSRIRIAHKRPIAWGGMLPQAIGERLCAKIRDILAVDDVPQYLTAEAAGALALQRAAMGSFAEPGRGSIEDAEGELRWWTFAGGRINHTLRYALGALHSGWKIIPDNFVIKIRPFATCPRQMSAPCRGPRL